jgi:Mce-associated membrane protein
MANDAAAADTELTDPPDAGVYQGGPGAGESIATADVNGTLCEDATPNAAAVRHHRPVGRLGMVAALMIVAVVGGLVGWLGFRAYDSHRRAQQRAVFLQVAREGALNLTTISYTEVDADIQRILDSSTGAFRDDFQKRSQPFVDVVKHAQSKSEGTITEAGLESVEGNTAQALVAVIVKTSNAGVAEQQPRSWRMRISVQRVGDDAKVANVEFVP